MITMKYDDINPPGIYIKFSKNKEWESIYATDTVTFNLDKEGKLCSMMIILPRDLEESTRKILKTINENRA